MSDLYEWEDGRLFVNGEYRAVLESKTDDDGICQHVTALCNGDETVIIEAWDRGYKAGMSVALQMVGDTVKTLTDAND